MRYNLHLKKTLHIHWRCFNSELYEWILVLFRVWVRFYGFFFRARPRYALSLSLTLTVLFNSTLKVLFFTKIWINWAVIFPLYFPHSSILHLIAIFSYSSSATITKFPTSDWINICRTNTIAAIFRNAITVWLVVSINGILSTYYFCTLMCTTLVPSLNVWVCVCVFVIGEQNRFGPNTEPNRTNSISFD